MCRNILDEEKTKCLTKWMTSNRAVGKFKNIDNLLLLSTNTVLVNRNDEN